MKRVLVTGGANIGKAGVATIVYKWGQSFDSDKIVYDYLMQRGLPDQQYVEAIKNKGGIIFTMDGNRKNGFSIIKWVENVVRENNYKTIHINTDTAYIAAAYIYAAKKGGIRHIFVHSHCTQVDDNKKLSRIIKTIIHRVCMPYVCKNTEKYLACSKMAGYWMFGKKNVGSKKYQTIYNGIEVEKYLYNEQIRNEYREKMQLGGKFVIGNIGRFSYQKNHEFLIKVFSEFLKKNRNAMLVLVGSGELESKLKKQVLKLRISDKVLFLGTRNDVPALLSMFDIFVMPSRFEGLPVTLVEAQMSSLPCVVSGAITKESVFTPIVTYVDGWNIDKWLISIHHTTVQSRNIYKDKLFRSNFNLSKDVIKLQSVLLDEEN